MASICQGMSSAAAALSGSNCWTMRTSRLWLQATVDWTRIAQQAVLQWYMFVMDVVCSTSCRQFTDWELYPQCERMACYLFWCLWQATLATLRYWYLSHVGFSVKSSSWIPGNIEQFHIDTYWDLWYSMCVFTWTSLLQTQISTPVVHFYFSRADNWDASSYTHWVRDSPVLVWTCYLHTHSCVMFHLSVSVWLHLTVSFSSSSKCILTKIKGGYFCRCQQHQLLSLVSE